MTFCANTLFELIEKLNHYYNLQLTWEKKALPSQTPTPQFPYIGLYNPATPPYIALFESKHLGGKTPLNCVPIGIICGNNPITPPPATTLLKTPLSAETIYEALNTHTNYLMKPKTCLHGTFVVIHDSGVLLQGPSGIGKSKTAMQLLKKGHRLVADDAPIFFEQSPNLIMGTCPLSLYGKIEIRGLGICHLSPIFGNQVFCRQHKLDLIINMSNTHNPEIRPLKPHYEAIRLFNTDIPAITINAAADEELSLQVEIATQQCATKAVFYDDPLKPIVLGSSHQQWYD